MFNTIVAVGTIALQILIIITIIGIALKKRLAILINNSHYILRIIFSGAVILSLVYQYGFGFEPCLLCWYQRIAIFGIAILVWTADVRHNALLRKQILIFAIAGLAVALFHNYIDIFPTGVDVCGATGPSCLIRYVYEFGYITIPIMSATTLLAGIIFTLTARCYPQPTLASSGE